jgi:hypothetical protein
MKRKKMSLIAQKIGQIFGNSVKKINYLHISNGSGVIIFLIKLQPRFFAKKMTEK